MPSTTGRLSKLTKHLQLAFLKASAQLVEFQQFAFLNGRVRGGMFRVPFVEPSSPLQSVQSWLQEDVAAAAVVLHSTAIGQLLPRGKSLPDDWARVKSCSQLLC